MSPTVREMATITITRETRQRIQAGVDGIAEAFNQIGRALAEALEPLLEFVRQLSEAITSAFPQLAGPIPARSYPGVSAIYAHRGRKR